MKPSIPDIGTVIRLEGGNAEVRMHSGGSCRRCGAAAIGLCTIGQMRVLTVRNSSRARVGDTVRIGLARRVQYAGYVLAYVVPAAAFLAGVVAGDHLEPVLGLPALDFLTGLLSLVAASFLSFQRLRCLDSSHSIEIVSILADPWEAPDLRADQQMCG